MKLTPAGAYRHRMTFQRAIQAGVDSQQQPVWQWVAIDATPSWVAIEPVSGRELFFGQQIQPDVTHVIKMRFRAALGLGPRDRGLYQGRTFEFVACRNLEERNIELWIQAIEQISSTPAAAPAAPTGVEAD